MDSRHPLLYEINARVWRHRFGRDATLLDIPEAYWERLARLGVTYVWLMGVWQTGPNVLDYALEPGLREAYSRALPNWQIEDIIGSPYAIDRYRLHPDLGRPEDLAALRERLNGLGLRLLLDFVPNHFHAESSLLPERPELFLEVDRHRWEQDRHTFFESPVLPGRYFAHGKDPNFAAWQDTLQLNFAAPATHTFLTDQLKSLAERCDGVRCDMAMLPQPGVFARTWGQVLGDHAGAWEAFWPKAIAAVKEKHPDFVLLGEVYWDMEWELQQAGFDYTYDKRLLDRLLHEGPAGIAGHLQAEQGFQRRSARFLENHDEERILAEMDERRAQAAAIVAYTIPGLRFFHDGQWEGRRRRLPVQLGREPQVTACTCAAGRWLPMDALSVQLPGSDSACGCTMAFYDRLLMLLREPLFHAGEWRQLAGSGQTGLLCWHWQRATEQALVVVNYQARSVETALPLPEGQWTEAFSGRQILVTGEDGHRLSFSPWGYGVFCSG